MAEQRAEILGIKFNILLTVENVRETFEDPKGRVESARHVEGPNSGRRWFLSLYPKGLYNESWSSVYLHLDEKSRESTADVKYSIEIVNDSCEHLYSGDGDRIRKTKIRRGVGEGWDFFINRKMLFDNLEPSRKYVRNDKLKILCRVEVQAKTRVPELQIQDDLEEMLGLEAFSDVSLNCEGRVFKCSKFMLASRSRVFRAMFEHENTKESRTGEVEIDDVRPEIMEQVVKFIYTDKDYVYDKETAVDVLRAADKYGLDRLKVMCEEAIIGSVSEENALDLLFFAKMFLLSNLGDRVLQFLKSRKPEFLAGIIDEMANITLNSGASD